MDISTDPAASSAASSTASQFSSVSLHENTKQRTLQTLTVIGIYVTEYIVKKTSACPISFCAELELWSNIFCLEGWIWILDLKTEFGSMKSMKDSEPQVYFYCCTQLLSTQSSNCLQGCIWILELKTEFASMKCMRDSEPQVYYLCIYIVPNFSLANHQIAVSCQPL